MGNQKKLYEVKSNEPEIYICTLIKMCSKFKFEQSKQMDAPHRNRKSSLFFMFVIIKNHLIKCFYGSKVVHLELITVTGHLIVPNKKMNKIFVFSLFLLLCPPPPEYCNGHTIVTTKTSDNI